MIVPSNVRYLVLMLLSSASLASLSGCTVHTTVAATPPPPPAEAPPPPPPAQPPPPPPAVVVAPPPPSPHAHPAYLHALSDLRNARANLERRGGDLTMKWDEHNAVGEIDRAIADIKRAALDDGKPLQDHPPIDVHEPRAGRLHRALAALQAARADVSQEEDNAFADGLRARALHGIDEAIRFAEDGIAEVDVRKPGAPPPPPVVVAPPPRQAHPAYLHALSDLRNARANLERRGGDFAMRWDERNAVEAIDRGIADIKQAALDDGKALQDHPPIDVHEPRAGRLHRALVALQAARTDVSQEEDNAFANGLRGRGLHDIDDAIRFAEEGITEVDQARAAPPAAAAPPVASPPPHPALAHPSYLHALSDLRNARAQLERKGGDRQMKWDERGAVESIDRAIAAIKHAALDDGKALQDHPPVDVHEARAGRLHKALAALHAARGDIDQEEDNAFADGLRARGLHEVDEAIRLTEQGIAEAEHSI
jgi:hypothetical protein